LKTFYSKYILHIILILDVYLIILYGLFLMSFAYIKS